MDEKRLFLAEVYGNALLLAARGDLQKCPIERTIAERERLVETFQRARCLHIVADFHDVRLFGAVVLCILLRLRKSVAARGGRMVFCNLSAPMRETLRATRLDAVWAIYANRGDAFSAVHGYLAWHDAPTGAFCPVFGSLPDAAGDFAFKPAGQWRRGHVNCVILSTWL